MLSFSSECFILLCHGTIFLSWWFFCVWYDGGRDNFRTFMWKKTFKEVGIFIFTVLTSPYKIIQLSRSPFISMTINLNKITCLFLTTITRDPPYWKHMELVNMPYCQAGRTCMQIYKKKAVSKCISFALISVVSLYNWCCARRCHFNWVWNGTDLVRGKSRGMTPGFSEVSYKLPYLCNFYMQFHKVRGVVILAFPFIGFLGRAKTFWVM